MTTESSRDGEAMTEHNVSHAVSSGKIVQVRSYDVPFDEVPPGMFHPALLRGTSVRLPDSRGDDGRPRQGDQDVTWARNQRESRMDPLSDAIEPQLFTEHNHPDPAPDMSHDLQRHDMSPVADNTRDKHRMRIFDHRSSSTGTGSAAPPAPVPTPTSSAAVEPPIAFADQQTPQDTPEPNSPLLDLATVGSLRDSQQADIISDILSGDEHKPNTNAQVADTHNVEERFEEFSESATASSSDVTAPAQSIPVMPAEPETSGTSAAPVASPSDHTSHQQAPITTNPSQPHHDTISRRAPRHGVSTNPDDKPLLRLSGLQAGYDGIRVLHGVDLTVNTGEIVALLGANGGGKTTTLKACAGLVEVMGGELQVAGRVLNGASATELANAGVCLVPEGRGVFPNLTVRENLWIATRPDKTRADVEEEAYSRFPKLGDRRNQVSGSMSGGEQQMLSLARALTSDPAILLLDELSMGLAPLIVSEIYEVVGGLVDEGVSLLVAEQFARIVLPMSDRAAVMLNGRIVAEGPPELIEQELSSSYLGG